jgi:DNA polymerase III epsilon subunit-like protein
MNYLILDIETTATDPQSGVIVEIGAVLLDSVTHELTDVFHQFINEGKPIDPDAWIFKHSNLTPAEIYQNGRSIEDIKPALQKLLDAFTTIAYNCQFDFRWLESRGFSIKNKTKDPMYITTPILGLRDARGREKWPKVQECLNYFGIKETEPHRALGDAHLEAMIVDRLITLGKL